MKIKEIVAALECWAPPVYQESYDNCGLIVGNAQAEISKVLVCLDCTEAIVAEAKAIGAGLIVAHHPIVFGGLKKLNGSNYVQRVVIEALKNDIAIFAIHTNLDNVATGVNHKICQLLGLQNVEILAPMADTLLKLVTFVPNMQADTLRNALFKAGAGYIGNYAECSFGVVGTGTFLATENANPVVGQVGLRHIEAETRIEVLVPKHVQKEVLSALFKAHPYEEVAYYLHNLQNKNQQLGAGMVGDLPAEEDALSFLKSLKSTLKTDCVRHTKLVKNKVMRIALCGGSGSFLLQNAIAAKADVFVTGDFTYHKFFDAEEKIIIADVGHFESEQFTIDLIADFLIKKFPTFATLKTSESTNPIAYL